MATGLPTALEEAQVRQKIERMRGTNAITGKALSGYDHIRQSLRDILSTPIGSRVMRRNYGSRIWELIDAPLTGVNVLQIYGATVEAVLTWEPRIVPVKVSVKLGKPGQLFITLEALVKDDGKTVTFDGIQIVK